MRYGKLKRYLKKWQDAGFISAEQTQQIAQYMRVESHRQFLKLVRVLFIMGAFWLLFGLVATLKLINVEILKAIGRFLYKLVTPLITLAQRIFPEHYQVFLSGAVCLVVWGLLHWLAMRLRRRSDITLTRLGYLQEKKELRLGTSALTMGYILASVAWQCFNYVFSPTDLHSYWGREVVVPWFSVVGLVFFFIIAYWMKDQIALLFGIGFLAQTVGLFTAYTFAAYWVSVSQPAIQLIVGCLLIFVGVWQIEKVKGREDQFQFLFGRTYEGTGLLFVYLSLWIMSIWGISYRENYWATPASIELWVANILFIAASIGALFYGAAKEDRIFFNFGLTFLIIESYTVFFSHIWETLGAAFGSLLLGTLLIGTGYLLRYLWLQGRILKKPSS